MLQLSISKKKKRKKLNTRGKEKERERAREHVMQDNIYRKIKDTSTCRRVNIDNKAQEFSLLEKNEIALSKNKRAGRHTNARNIKLFKREILR